MVLNIYALLFIFVQYLRLLTIYAFSHGAPAESEKLVPIKGTPSLGTVLSLLALIGGFMINKRKK